MSDHTCCRAEVHTLRHDRCGHRTDALDAPASSTSLCPKADRVSRAASDAKERDDAIERRHPAIRIAVADDSYLIRDLLEIMLSSAPGIELVAICSDGNELWTEIERKRPDVVLTDIRMPPSGATEGIRIANLLREHRPETGVVVLSQYAEPTYALELLGCGTERRAYLLKERIRAPADLFAAIEAVARGRSVVDPLVVELLIQARLRAARSRLSELTPREREVLAEIATGKSNNAIAESLVLTKRAVEKHVNSIFSKLNLSETEKISRRVKAALIFLAEG
jgi:DNA-binding NarL/FixJ family response regulator